MFGCRCRMKHLARFCCNSRWSEAMRREWWGCQGLSWIGEGLACLLGCIAPTLHCWRIQQPVKLCRKLKTCFFRFDLCVKNGYFISFKLLYLTTRSQFIRFKSSRRSRMHAPTGLRFYMYIQDLIPNKKEEFQWKNLTYWFDKTHYPSHLLFK